ncbi:hypothetical protein [Sulfurirhabdus autotrophica]|uniref:Uncharacterized protein n=1 Tax=Sulfurirhabdus autotrophica TaxID=1706046 RepID=A0A4R3XS66_9PROT|nr:hypothetical protein [Sulfurirhabdus autotrophica]TCV81076.1 hypothetical protein EDC63_12734 [Sulfurirhabdus autotrophica]
MKSEDRNDFPELTAEERKWLDMPDVGKEILDYKETDRNDFPLMTPKAIAAGYREVTEEERRALPDIFRRNGIMDDDDQPEAAKGILKGIPVDGNLTDAESLQSAIDEGTGAA